MLKTSTKTKKPLGSISTTFFKSSRTPLVASANSKQKTQSLTGFYVLASTCSDQRSASRTIAFTSAWG
jgi:hypothetical protein